MRVLTVHQAFGDYAVGHMIQDQKEQAAVLEAGQGHFCTPTEVEESFFEPEPEPAADPAPAKRKQGAGS